MKGAGRLSNSPRARRIKYEEIDPLCALDVATWPQCNAVLDEVLADNRCTVDGASALVPSVPSIFVGDIGGHAFERKSPGLVPGMR